jgi:hypothetical protein
MLDRELQYVTDKDIEEEAVYLTAAWNCTEDTASEKMMRTKEIWGKGDDAKRDLILLYHMDQSFLAGEVTPELAHEIGCEFVQRVFADRYEVVMGTHIDKDHIHNHFLINSVSFVDGKRFRNESTGIKAFYFSHIRKTSDDLCREHNLSIIGENYERTKFRDKSGHYQDWKNKEAFMNKRDFVRIDVDAAIAGAKTFDAFCLNLQNMGYAIKVGSVTHMAIKGKDQERFVRCRSLGEGYDEASIRLRIERPELYEEIPPRYDPNCYWTNRRSGKYVYVKRSHRHLSYKQMRKIGIVSNYFHYMYVLGLMPKNRSRKYPQRMRTDVLEFRKLTEQFNYLLSNKIETRDDLDNHIEALEQKKRAALFLRNRAYTEARREENQTPDAQEAFAARKDEARAYLKDLRKEISLCNRIGGYDEEIQEIMRECRELENKVKERDLL